jgi:hypothetical protein
VPAITVSTAIPPTSMRSMPAALILLLLRAKRSNLTPALRRMSEIASSLRSSQ